jgi:hypothetical protein
MYLSRGRIRARALGHVLVLACLTLACTSAAASAAPVPDGFYGVNSGSTLVNDPIGRPAALQAMRAGGLSFVRVDASWGGVEPLPPVAGMHTYVWTLYDLFVADLARNGLRWYPAVAYSAPWASSESGDPFAPPADDGDFAAFAGALAARYGSQGSFWAAHPELPKLPMTTYGIWNEPSNPHFWHGAAATPARYMRLYLAARAAIRAADPLAQAATAGLLDSGAVDGGAFLRAMLDSAPAARDQIDAVGWHPYVGDLGQTLASVARARTALDQRGLGAVPIEVSEVGWWHTGGFSATQRAGILRGLAAQLPHSGMNVTRLLPYVWTGDAEWQITDVDGSLGQVGGAYFAGIRDARAAADAPVAVPTVRRRTTVRKTQKSCRMPARPAPRRTSRSKGRCITLVGAKRQIL